MYHKSYSPIIGVLSQLSLIIGPPPEAGSDLVIHPHPSVVRSFVCLSAYFSITAPWIFSKFFTNLTYGKSKVLPERIFRETLVAEIFAEFCPIMAQDG